MISDETKLYHFTALHTCTSYQYILTMVTIYCDRVSSIKRPAVSIETIKDNSRIEMYGRKLILCSLEIHFHKINVGRME